MGQLIDGVWHDVWYDTKSTGGSFKRSESVFRNWLTADGEPGANGKGGFAAEKDRYHLYVSLACPWAHRTLIMRALKGLESFISVSVVNPLMLQDGWTFDDDFPNATGDGLYQLTQTTPAALPFRFYGTRKPRRLSVTNPLKSFAC
jgi:putative glutathione S-transferase